MADVRPGVGLMSHHPIMQLIVHAYVSILLALGSIGFGWVLVLCSQSMVSLFSFGKWSRFGARVLAISGWISLVGGCLSIAMFLILLLIIGLR
jgi:hypothetical protein